VVSILQAPLTQGLNKSKFGNEGRQTEKT